MEVMGYVPIHMLWKAMVTPIPGYFVYVNLCFSSGLDHPQHVLCVARQISNVNGFVSFKCMQFLCLRTNCFAPTQKNACHIGRCVLMIKLHYGMLEILLGDDTFLPHRTPIEGQ